MGEKPFKLLVDSGSEQDSPIVTRKIHYDGTSTKSTTYGGYRSDDTSYEIKWGCTCTNQIDAAALGYSFKG